MNEFKRALRDPHLLSVMIMGFASGLPLLLIGATLKAWLVEQKVDLTTVGLFSLVGIPYTWKFIWSPLMDRFVPPLGRRRGWLLISQAGVMASLVALSFMNAADGLAGIIVCSLCVAFFSASQDIVVDAYRREILPDAELGLGSSLYVNGYRTAMMVASAGSLFLADHIPWREVYWIMAALMLVGVFAALFSPEPTVVAPPPRTLRESVVGPLQEFFSRDRALFILGFVLLYKIGESMASDMYNPFYLLIGFTKSQIAAISKIFGFWAMVGGGLVGGLMIVRIGIFRALWIFGLLQSLALLLFSALAQIGPNVTMLGIAVTVENFTSGMATTAYVAYMASQTDRRFTATQMALLSSLMGVPRAVLGASTGWLAQNLGWTLFFIACAVFTIPGLVLCFTIRKQARVH